MNPMRLLAPVLLALLTPMSAHAASGIIKGSEQAARKAGVAPTASSLKKGGDAWRAAMWWN